MTMDVTTLFKACVKTARIKNKSLPLPDKNRILAARRKSTFETEFNKRTKNICYQLVQLRDFLVENRAAYMKFGCHLKGMAQKMTDSERDIIDEETDKILDISTQLIIELRQECRSYKTTKQNTEYMDNVLESLTNFLKNIFKISNQMRTYRVKKELQTYRLLKLESDKKRIPVAPKGKKIMNGMVRLDSENYEEEDEVREDFGGFDDEDASDIQQDTDDLDTSNRRNNSSKLALDEEIANNQSSYIEDEDDLSPEDIQMFESENTQLYNELKGLSEEVEQIEKNVTEIAKLQDLFTEKVKI